MISLLVALLASKYCQLLVSFRFKKTVLTVSALVISLAVPFSSAGPTVATAEQPVTDYALSGRVQTGGPQPPDALQLRVEESGNVIFTKMVELADDGTFTVHLGSLHSKQILCTVSVAGFSPQRITGLVSDKPTVSLGTIRLSPFVELGPVSVTKAEGDISVVEFWITSHVAKNLTFINISISSSQMISGPCFDSDPMLTMRFAMVAQKASGLNKLPSVGATIHISTDDPTRAHNQPVLQINGEVTRDSCGPLLLRLVAPYSFTLTASDQSSPRKIRLEVPNSISVPKWGVIHPDWSHSTVVVEMDSQEKISGRPKQD